VSKSALKRGVTVQWRFSNGADEAVFLDDVILLEHRRPTLGDVDGPRGTLYVVQEASRYRVGVCRQFELVIVGDRIVAWYDLTTDADRMNNLADKGGLGPMLFDVNDDGALLPIRTAKEIGGAVRTTVVGEGGSATCQIVCRVFAEATPLPSQRPVQMTTFSVSRDGRVKIDLLCATATKKLAVEYRLNNDVGFDPIVGRIRNPLGPAQSRIGYALLRRMGGPVPTSDFLAAWRPWTQADGAIACELVPSVESIAVRFVGQATPGEVTLEGFLRVWPTTIDTLADGERYVREFANQASSIVGRSMPMSASESRGASSVTPAAQQAPAAAWSPTMDVKE